MGAPIDGGLGILLAMGAANGGKKLYAANKAGNKEFVQVAVKFAFHQARSVVK